jgi:ATP phosphoribosyltransferase regulatory subunit
MDRRERERQMQRDRLDQVERLAPTTPSGATDVMLDDAVRKSALESSLRRQFESWGYAEVVPPIFERYETLLAGGIRPEWVYRFTDPSGEVLALRPDLTTQVARVVATRLREQPKPLRLFYVGSVIRRPKPSKGLRTEFSQAGIELVGSSEPMADAEVVAIAIEALLQLGVEDFQIHLGQSAFFRGIVEETRLLEAEIVGVKELLDRRDRQALERFLSSLDLAFEQRRAILECLDLCGREEVLDRSYALVDNQTSKAAAENLAEIYQALTDCALADRVVIDLAEVRGLDYYTGMMIEGFTRSLSVPILEGGRYDNLIGKFGYICPAVGCAFDVSRVAAISAGGTSSPRPTAEVLVRMQVSQRKAAYALAATLRSEGRRVELEVMNRDEEAALTYAQQRGIAQLITVEDSGTRSLDVATRESRGGDRCSD